MKQILTIIFAIIVVAGAFALTGCDSEDEKTYDVTIKWTIADMPICESPSLDTLPESLQDPEVAGTADNKLVVDNILLKVFEEPDDPDPIRELTLPCIGSNNTYSITSLDRGNYTVKLDGMATYDGATLPFYNGESEIVAPNESITEIALRIVGGSVKVVWEFDAGMCGANGVETVNITIFGEEYGTTYTQNNVACIDGVVIKEDVDWDIYHVEMEGFDASNTLTHTGSSAESFKVRPGEEVQNVVVLTPN
jgi:hypothetical protein